MVSQDTGGGWRQVMLWVGNSTFGGDAARAEFHSQAGQDEVVAALFNMSGPMPGRYFVDIAANDAVTLSNTLHLERLGWDGLCIEPNPQFWWGLAHRRCAVIGAVVAESDNGQVAFNFLPGGTGGIMRSDVKRTGYQLQMQHAMQHIHPHGAHSSSTQNRPTLKLERALQHAHAPRVIDYVSLDVEGAEPLLLKAFPFDRYAVRLLSIEGGRGHDRLPSEFVCIGSSAPSGPDKFYVNTRTMPNARAIVSSFRHKRLDRARC